MIKDPKITEKLIDIIDSAHDEALLIEVITSAIESALKESDPQYLYNRGAMDQRILELFQEAAREWDLNSGHECL